MGRESLVDSGNELVLDDWQSKEGAFRQSGVRLV